MMRKLILLAAFLPIVAYAQGGIPTATSLGIVSQISANLYAMVNQHVDLFVGEGLTILNSLGIILLIWYGIMYSIGRAGALEQIIELLLGYAMAYTFLQFYDTPAPFFGGASFHQIIPNEAAWICKTIDLTVVNSLISSVFHIWQGAERPMAVNIFATLVYLGFGLDLAIIWFLASGVTLIGHLALGFGALIGPILIPFFIWPIMSWLFWGWIRFTLIYSFYFVAASAIVLVYANVMLWFLNGTVGLDFSIGHFAALLIPMTVLNLIFVFALWQCHGWARDIISGQASMGSPLGGVATALVARL
jgi:hypothetical protein